MASYGSAILFDLDNTLVDRVAALYSWATLAVATFWPDGDTTNLVSLIEIADGDGYVPRSRFFSDVASILGGVRPSEVENCYLDEYPQQFVLDIETRMALGRLSKNGHRLAVVTNGPLFQNDVIRASGLDVLVDAWVVSEVAGVRKPDPAILQPIIEEIGELGDGAIFVGDGIVDMEMAAASDLQSIWLRRGRQWTHESVKPTYEVDDLAEAFRVLEAL